MSPYRLRENLRAYALTLGGAIFAARLLIRWAAS